MTTSAHLAASATSMTFRPAFSALAAEGEPLRSATTMSFTPESRRFRVWAWPLAAVADDGNLLALDQIDVGVAIVIDTHGPQIPYLEGGVPPVSIGAAPAFGLRNIYFVRRRF